MNASNGSSLLVPSSSISRRILPEIYYDRVRKKCNVYLEKTNVARQTSRCSLVEDTEKKKKGEGGKMEISEFSLRRDIIYLDYQGGFRKFQV